jgi:class 3 adenylate cyclase
MRVGLHTGEPELSDEGYVGATVHRTARVANAGHGGQVLLTDATRAAAGDAWPVDAAVLDLGEFQLRGLQRPERIFQLVAPGLALDFPALRAEVG